MLLLCCLGLWYFTDLPKVLAPRLRKGQEDPEPVSDFFDRGDAAVMEDADPELNMNPVWLARMKAERDKERARKQKRGRWMGGPGALARLGLRISEPREQEPLSPSKGKEKGPRFLKQVDSHIAKQQQAAAAVAGSSAHLCARPAGAAPSAAEAHRADKQRAKAAERLDAAAQKTHTAAAARMGARAAASNLHGDTRDLTARI